MIRLNKYLAECGVASRRKCDQLIAEGKVWVNGIIETKLGTKVDEDLDQVKLHDRLVRPVKKSCYYILNKPKGVVTTTADERDRKTVLDLLGPHSRVFPVGRLDIDSTGLVLLTNDGDLTYKLTHPKFKVGKTYEVLLETELKSDDLAQLESGVRLEEGITGKCRVEFHRPNNRKLLRMTIHQGWNRQVRRMFAVLGYEVKGLKRVRISFLHLDSLKPGEYRSLTTREIDRLKRRFAN